MTSKPGQPLPGLPQGESWRILRRAFGYLRPYWHLTAGAYATLLLITGLSLLTPQFIRWIVDRGVRAGDLALLGWAVLGLVGLAGVKGFITYWQGKWTEVASQNVARDLRKAIHSKLSDLSFSYHDRTETGQLLTRAVEDVERIRFLTGRAVVRLAEGVVLLLGTAVALAWMNPLLALLSLATLPLLVYRAISFSRRFRPLSLQIQGRLSVLTTRLDQNLRGARTVKAFAQEDAEIARFDTENQRWFDVAARAARLQAFNMPAFDLIANAGAVLILWVGGTLVIRGELTLGELVAFTTYLGQLVVPVRRLGLILPALAQASASGERIFEILDAHSEVQDAPGAYPLPAVAGHVRFEDVSFAYLGRHRVLSHVSLEAQPGQIIALLGATGSGKTTIVNLIPRFYDPDEGCITVDGHDIRKVTLASLREQIGIVLQETTLFAATIRENIAFGKPAATDEEVVAAAQAAQAHDFIMQMPDGYDTAVGERGMTLSGGQRQRVAIARALLTDPRVLILDDATSSVDAETERLIQMALERLMSGRTSFVIAQRLSTVRMADQILVLENGRIVAAGAHAELLRTCDLYATIYYSQLRPQEGPAGMSLDESRLHGEDEGAGMSLDESRLHGEGEGAGSLDESRLHGDDEPRLHGGGAA